MPDSPYYRADLAKVHHLGFARHAANTAPGILALLEPVRARDGLVLEVGCGTGLLTRHLIDAGHRVIATDASPAMIDLAREVVPDALELRVLTLPDDPLPEVDAIVSVGHVLSYLDDATQLERAFDRLGGALRPNGVLAVDLCDLRYGQLRTDAAPYVAVTDEWAIFTHYALPRPDQFVRAMTTFVRAADGTWRRDDERHDNVLIDTSLVPGWLAPHGIATEVRSAFGTEELPAGLVVIVGHRRL
jgi:SAM-dependent methyltransferase